MLIINWILVALAVTTLMTIGNRLTKFDGACARALGMTMMTFGFLVGGALAIGVAAVLLHAVLP